MRDEGGNLRLERMRQKTKISFNMKNKRHTLRGMRLASFAVASSFLFTACGQDGSEPEAAATAASPLEHIQVLDTKPADALPVKTAREQLKPGDAAVVFGQIGGVLHPFLDGYAGFVLGDTDIVFCNEMGDDHCPTPWDACCEDADKLKASRASVQFVDGAGQILPGSMAGFSGLAGLSEVVVQGTVAEGSTPENLIIEASSIYVAER